MGIISLGASPLKHLFKNTEDSTAPKPIVYRSKLIIFEIEAPQTVRMPACKLSRIGKELMKLGNFDIDPEYMNQLVEFLKGQGCKVFVGDFKGREGDTYRHENLGEV